MWPKHLILQQTGLDSIMTSEQFLLLKLNQAKRLQNIFSPSSGVQGNLPHQTTSWCEDQMFDVDGDPLK